MLGRILPELNQTEQRIKYLAQGSITVTPVIIELATPRSQVIFNALQIVILYTLTKDAAVNQGLHYLNIFLKNPNRKNTS